MKRPTVFILVVSALIACSDSSGPSRPAVCDGPVTLSISSSPTPEISWTPNCRISGLSVMKANPDAVPFVYWTVTSPVDSAPIEGPITYGEEISGANTGTAADLPMGDSVLVSLYVSNSELPDSGLQVGEGVGRIPFLPDLRD